MVTAFMGLTSWFGVTAQRTLSAGANSANGFSLAARSRSLPDPGLRPILSDARPART